LDTKKQRGQIATAVEVRPRTLQTSKATTTLSRGVFAYSCLHKIFGRFQQQISAKRYI